MAKRQKHAGGRPKLPDEKRGKLVTVYLRPATIEKLEQLSKSYDMGKSEVVSELINTCDLK